LPTTIDFPGHGLGARARVGFHVKLLPYLGQDALYRKYDFSEECWAEANQSVVSTRMPVFNCPSAPQGLFRRGGGEKANFNENRTFKGAALDYAAIFSTWGMRIGPDHDRDGCAATNVVAVGANGNLVQKPRLELVSDGTSNTLLMVEQSATPQQWIKGKRVGDRPPGWNGSMAQHSIFLYSFTESGDPVRNGVGSCAVNCSNEHGIYAFHTGGANALFVDGSVKFLRDGLDPNVMFALVSRAGGEIIGSGDY